MGATDEINIRGGGSADIAAGLDQDHLGFKPYVEGVYSYLKNPQTNAPFTISIEGEWGAGKSSFLNQLEESLKKDGFITMRFNAWRHDKVESMWAAFALDFIDGLRTRLCFCDRVLTSLQLQFKRFDWSKGRFAVFKSLLIFVSYLFILTILLKNTSLSKVMDKGEADMEEIIKALGAFGGLIIFPLVLKQISEVFGNPFKADLEKFISMPKYEGNSSFIEEFHKDLKHITQVLAPGGGKIFVFIDDLDRAEVPKAAELMQGLHMMIADSQRIIFIIGMDREKVAAGVAAKYKDVIPFLYESPPGNTIDYAKARSYGLHFLEKFIQLSFLVPKPSDLFIREYIDSLSGVMPQGATRAIVYRPILHIKDGNDDQLFRDVVYQISPFLNHNPRSIKQFVNTFRLKAHIAYSTGLFALDPTDPSSVALTIPQLGKFVAITTIYPLIVEHMLLRRDLLADINITSLSGYSEYWINHAGFMKLFKLNVGLGAEWDLKDIRLDPLVETTPVYEQVQINIIPPLQSPAQPGLVSQASGSTISGTASSSGSALPTSGSTQPT
ncbi:MAG: P-loop NTPase fold protein [Bacteroidota bacterium]